MSKPDLTSKKQCEKLEYAASLILKMDAKGVSTLNIAETALKILEFGGITAREMLDYIDSTGQ